MEPRRRPGEHVLIRHVLRERVLHAVPSRVVEHTESALVTWIAPGTSMAYPRGLDERGALLSPDRWEIELRSWFGNGCVDLTPTGRPHMIRHFWRDGAFQGWYLNLQRPLVPSALGFDTMDLQLDLWIAADGQVTWKDEDHLEQAVGFGMLDEAEAASARAEAERVLGEWPFPTGWEDWRPDPSWPLPELPAAWSTVPAGTGAG